MPDDAADPAQDPNNQGEDEFEEAELERPDFEEKVGGSEKFKEPGVKEEPKEKPPKVRDWGQAAGPGGDPQWGWVGTELKDCKETIRFLDGSKISLRG